MGLRKKHYYCLLITGAVFLLFAFTNCSSKDAGSSNGSVDLGSTGCKVNPDVLVSQVKDGDYHVQVYADADDVQDFSEKLYLNNQGDPSKAPRWKTNVINWYYNPSGAPASVAATALDTIKTSMAYWTSVCNINFNYMGTSTKASSSNNIDSMNVIGWGDANGATGITYSYMKTTSTSYNIYESDMNFNTSEVTDSTTLRGVANHELGHFLGLAHSDVSASIMYANPYHDIQYLLTLRADDIAGCVGLYGAAVSATPTPTPAPMVTPTPTPSVAPVVTPVPTVAPPVSPTKGC